jgi:alkanesulfonate monooxygenase SsuD/methylene tetrahydromethanopterin reductase-like flavin-dependent oxidoreductase (luciferase family)
MPIFGPLADTRLHAELAATAEEAGWDGYFVWDHIRWPWVDEIIDPWAAMTAIALRTERIRIGPMVTPIPRRRPQVVARQTVTLDRLSGGRLIFGAGSGGDHATEYANLGELTDPKVRAAQLDEGLAVLVGLWSGQRFNFDGSHYQVKDTTFLPTPLQTPRIPVWIAGQWPYRKPLARAARWDGYVPIKADMSLTTPDETAQMAQTLDLPSRRGFDLAVFSGPQDPAPFFAAGATWCLDGPEPEALDVESIRRWIASGPRR